MIVFINSYNHNKSNRFASFSPVFPPIGIGYLASIARERGIRFKILDQQVNKNIENIIINDNEIRNAEYVLFAFSVVTPAFEASKKTARILKKIFPTRTIIFGGIHPTVCPKEVLTLEEVMIVVRGEGETTLFNLYNCLQNNISWKEIPGISFMENGELKNNPSAQLIENLDTLPLFPYDLFKNNPRYDLGIILSSRGCKMNCIFCSNNIISRFNVRYSHANIVIQQIELLVKTYNKKHILFLDDNFLEDERRIFELTKMIKSKGLHNVCSFSIQARCNQVNSRIMKELFSSGFKTIFLGIETFSERLLKSINKRLTPEIIENSISIATKSGFKVQASFIFGFPDETYNDRRETLKFVLKSKIEIAKFNNLVPYPGTPVFIKEFEKNNINFSSDYSNADTLIALTDGIFRKRQLPFINNNNEPNEIKRFMLLSYFLFYFRLKNMSIIFNGSENSIKWMYFRDEQNKFSWMKIFSLFSLFSTLSLKFLGIFFVPSKANLIYWNLTKQK